MSDDLVKRLRDLGDHASFEPHIHHTAADRIEELEAKLAKVEVLMSAGFAEYERRLSKVKEAFRRNMMQAPAYTHEQFDKDYEEMMAEP